MIPGGGAPEVEISQRLAEHARTLSGVESLIVRAYADSLEIIPYTLAENAGLNPINVVTELRNKHIKKEKEAGINVKKGICDNMLKENVIQPALVTQSALTLSTECVRMILKIDDLVIAPPSSLLTPYYRLCPLVRAAWQARGRLQRRVHIYTRPTEIHIEC